MHFSAATALTLLTTLSVTLGSPLLETRQNGVTCQTSGGSPKTDDVTEVFNKLNGRGGDHCPQKNGEASDCTTLVKHGSAAISICGGKDSGDGALCTDLADYAKQIQQTCVGGNPARVGGTYTINPSQRLEVINSDST